MDPALRLERLTKSFGATRAVDELDLIVTRGATYGFIGPSGAGVLGHRSATRGQGPHSLGSKAWFAGKLFKVNLRTLIRRAREA